MPNPSEARAEMPAHPVAAGLPVVARVLGEVLRERR